jgi:hypothetical protein
VQLAVQEKETRANRRHQQESRARGVRKALGMRAKCSVVNEELNFFAKMVVGLIGIDPHHPHPLILVLAVGFVNIYTPSLI